MGQLPHVTIAGPRVPFDRGRDREGRRSPEMTLRSRFIALTYDRQMAMVDRAGLRAHREAVLAEARGDVLEIGAGTGANLAIYGPAVTSLTLTDAETPMVRRLTRKARQQAPHAKVLPA